jgi:hypothetical protein
MISSPSRSLKPKLPNSSTSTAIVVICGSGQRFVKFKKSACILVPKAFTFSRTVAGLISTG